MHTHTHATTRFIDVFYVYTRARVRNIMCTRYVYTGKTEFHLFLLHIKSILLLHCNKHTRYIITGYRIRNGVDTGKTAASKTHGVQQIDIAVVLAH